MASEDIKPHDSAEMVENLKSVANFDLALPPDLESLDDSELRTLEKSLVRRLDCFLMPSVLLLFLLNILDRWALDALDYRACVDQGMPETTLPTPKSSVWPMTST